MDVGGPCARKKTRIGKVRCSLAEGRYQELAGQASAARMAAARNKSSELLNWIILTEAVEDTGPLHVEVDGGSAVWELE